MKKILVPIDFSKSSINSLELSSYIARKLKASIELIHVLSYGPFQYPVFPLMDTVYNADAEILTKGAEKSFNKKMEKLVNSSVLKNIKTVYTIKRSNRIFDEIVSYAEGSKADLIIMSTKGNTGLSDIVFGSNAERVVKYSKTPIIVTSEKFRNKDIKKVLFASDFSDEAYSIFPSIKKFANALNAEIYLVKVNTRDEFRPTHHNYKQLNKFLKHFKVKLNNFVYDDYIKEDGIINYAREINADMIILGTHGKSLLKRFFTQNISGDIVNLSHLPVLTFQFSK
jgi:nucleotide-binding universal stress UspA family protein